MKELAPIVNHGVVDMIHVCGYCGCSSFETVRITDSERIVQYERCWECKERLTDIETIREFKVGDEEEIE